MLQGSKEFVDQDGNYWQSPGALDVASLSIALAIASDLLSQLPFLHALGQDGSTSIWQIRQAILGPGVLSHLSVI